MILAIIRFLLPLLFLLLVAGAFGIVFEKNIELAAAPAFFSQIIVIILSAIIFESFSLGILIGIVASIATIAVKCIKDKSISGLKRFYWPTADNIGVYIFVAVYILVYVANFGKTYSHWDEYSHWGIFVKEMFRLDKLYCASPAMMAHKDYVPALSVFEALWCKLSFRCKEADEYRAIQFLMASMLMPLLTVNRHEKKNGLNMLFRAVIVFGVPMYVQNFFTILPDFALGIIVFYALFVILTSESYKEAFVMLLPALTTLVLVKMVAIAFLPMIVIFFLVYFCKFEKTATKKFLFIDSIILVTAPLVLWKLFNNYVDKYVQNTGGRQSYDGISFDSIKSVFSTGFTDSQIGIISIYFKALWQDETFKNLAFLPIVIVVILLVTFVFITQKDKQHKEKMCLVLLWIVISAIVYVLFMCTMYLFMFSEVEANRLAGYYRYMSTYLIAIVYLTVAVIVLFMDVKKELVLTILACVIFENGLVFFGFYNYLPDFNGKEMSWKSEAEAIVRNADENDKVFLLTCGDNGMIYHTINYQVVPIYLNWGSVGPARYEGDLWSKDYTIDEFTDLISEYKYFYFLDTDDVFLDKYTDAFVNPEVIKDHVIYEIEERNGRILLTEGK